MASRGPFQGRMEFGGLGGPFAGPPPRDLVGLLAIVFVTYSLQFFRATAAIPVLLQLSPDVWQRGYLWQVVTYAFAGFGPASVWILLELFVLYWFGRDVFVRLGRRRFWRTVLIAAGGAGVTAVAVHLLATAAFGGPPTAFPFVLAQGQRTLLAIVVAAFARLYADATVLLFFVLPLRARWFVWLGPLLGFVGFLSTHDAGGLAGLCAATAIAYRPQGGAGPGRTFRRWRLRLQERWLKLRLDRLRRRRGMRVVDGGRDGEPPRWVH